MRHSLNLPILRIVDQLAQHQANLVVNLLVVHQVDHLVGALDPRHHRVQRQAKFDLVRMCVHSFTQVKTTSPENVTSRCASQLLQQTK